MDTILIASQVTTPTHIFTTDDNTDYGLVTYFSDSKSILKLQGPSTTIYNNINFGTPDFNYPGTLTKDITIPLVSGSIPQGSYVLTATTHITKVLSTLAVNLGTNTITMPLPLLDNFYAGQSIVWTGGANAGTYTVQSVSSSGSAALVVLVQSLISTSLTGSLSFDEVIITVKSYTFCYSAPAVNITLTPNCVLANLAEGDSTNYAISCEGQTIQPTSNSKTFILDAPLNESGVPVYPQTVSSVPITTTQLWTQTWTLTLTSDLVYTLPSGLIVSTSVTGTKPLDVSCDDSLCCMSSCLQNATASFLLASSNSSDLNALVAASIKYERILGAFMLYSIGVRCGDMVIIDAAVASLKDYLKDVKCCNDCGDTGQSVQIIPIYNVNISGNSVVVQSGDVYIDVSAAVVGSTTTYTLTLDVIQVQNLISDYIISNPSLITNIVNSMALGTFISAYPSAVDTSVKFSGTTTNGSAVITGITFGTGINQSDITTGEPVYHANLPIGTYIDSIIPGVSITMSAAFTFTGSTNNVLIGTISQGIGIFKYRRDLSGVVSHNFIVRTQPTMSLATDPVTGMLSLLNDNISPGVHKFYSTNYNGDNGWFSIRAVLVENAGGTATAGANTDYAIATITAPTAGLYHITANIGILWSSTAPSSYTVSIVKNGAIINAQCAATILLAVADTAASNNQSLTTLAQLVNTDVVALRIRPVGQDVTTTDISVTLVRLG